MNINISKPLPFLSGFFLKPGRNTFGFSALIPFLFIGIIFTIFGIIPFSDNFKTNNNWKSATGKVVNVSSYLSGNSRLYTPTIQYAINGQTYNVKANFSTSTNPKIGSERKVKYNSLNPNEAIVSMDMTTNLIILIFPTIGILFIIFGPILFIKSLFRTKEINNLLKNGRKIQGVIVDVQNKGRTNNSNTYQIVVAAPDAVGALNNYISDTIRGGMITLGNYSTNPIPIDVFIDSVNPNKYYVDISDIPSLTTERVTQMLKSATNNTTTSSVQPPIIVN